MVINYGSMPGAPEKEMLATTTSSLHARDYSITFSFCIGIYMHAIRDRKILLLACINAGAAHIRFLGIKKLSVIY